MKCLSEIVPDMGSVVALRRENETAVAISADRLRDAAANLRQAEPAKNTGKLLAAVTKIVGGHLPATVNSLFGPDGAELIGTALTDIRRPRGITAAQISKALYTVTLSLAPAPERDLAAALGELSLRVIRRAEEDRDLAARIVLYARELQHYPADVAMAALQRPWRFFPAWAELLPVLTSLAQPRLALSDAIAGWRPWSQEDEIASLARLCDRLRSDIRWYDWRDPDRATEAAEALAWAEDEIAAIQRGDRASPEDGAEDPQKPASACVA